ncbi:MAG: fimbria major subunit [Porphyromonas sp.]|nr:fimbria major subunit [Porphyromonas sp.]
MKTNLKATVMLALLLVGASCERERGKPLLVEPKLELTEGSFLRLSIQNPNQVVLRSTETDPLKSVRSVGLLFYNQDTEVLEHIRELSVSSISDLSNLVVKLPPADYKLVVVANASTQLRSSINPGAPLSDFIKGRELKAIDLFEASRGIVMTNQQGVISVPSSAFVSSVENEQTAISIALEPSLARVLVYGNPKFSRGTKGVTKPMYQITNQAKQVSLLRQMNKLSDESEEQAQDNSSREQRYAKSPYWDIWVQTPPRTTEDIAAYSTDNAQADRMKLEIKERSEDFATMLSQVALYAKETTLPPNSYFEGTTPCVTIAYPYVPQGLQLEGEEGWVSYKGRYYREGAVKEMLRANTEPNSNELLQAMRQNQITETSFANSKGFDIAGVRFYYKAYSYYTVYIRHFSSETPSSGYGKYGIVRGNEYRISIAEITAPGSPVPPTYSNNLKPITEQKAAGISVRIDEIPRRDQEAQL